MKYFEAIYTCISKHVEIFAESYDKGLEFRLRGDFFYDPRTQTYNHDLAKRLFDVKEQTNGLREHGQTEKKTYLAQNVLALILHTLLHPNNTYKASRQMHREYTGQ